MEVSTIFKWRIDDFMRTMPLNGVNNPLFSPDFILRNGVIVQLEFDPINTKEKGDRTYCSAYLCLKDLTRNNSITLNCNLWAENNIGTKLVARNKDHIDELDDVNTSWGYAEFIQRTQIYGPSFVKNNVVFICCNIQIVKTTKKHSLPTFNPQNLAIEVGKKEWLFYEQGFTGLCTIQVNGKDFKIGKNKLMASSPFFERMFKSGMQETQTGIIDLKKSSMTVIQTLIKYLHVHQIENANEVVVELYSLADKYEIGDLKANCAQTFINELNKDNILDVLILSFKHNDECFQQGIFDYLNKCPSTENFKEIMKSDEWIDFMRKNKQMGREIIDKVFMEMGWM